MPVCTYTSHIQSSDISLATLQNSLPILRLEELRDARQGEYPSSALELFRIARDTWPLCQMVALGWPYIDQAHAALAQYLRDHADNLSSNPAFNRQRFLVYTLIHIGADQVDPNSPFGKMLDDMRNDTQPYGTVNILTKARVADVSTLSADMTSERMRSAVKTTMQLLAKANSNIKIEIAIEHFYSAWIEGGENRAHIIATIRDYLIEVKQLLGDEGLACARITAADTDGAHNNFEIAAVIGALTQELQRDPYLTNAEIAFHPGIFTAHMHDDRGLAITNTLQALDSGAGAVDVSLTAAGERMGNARLAQLIKELPEFSKNAQSMGSLADQSSFWNGGREDKTKGSPLAFVATGGMHAATILKRYLEQARYGVTYQEFCRGYRGSYAGVPADQFGQSLSVALSPVAGAANVLFMLAGLGYDISSLKKNDDRVARILSTVKAAEFKEGQNYRGYNNVNAMLLLARIFGLREYNSFGAEAERAGNKLELDYRSECGYDSDDGCFAELKLSTGEIGVEPLVKSYRLTYSRVANEACLRNLTDADLLTHLTSLNLRAPDGATREIMIALIKRLGQTISFS